MGATHHNNSEETAPWFTKAGMTDRLIALHGKGIGYTAIARILTDEYALPVTKNQVVGKARRMDLARRKPIGLQPKLPRHKLETPRKRKPQAPLSDGRPGSPRPSVPLPPPTPTILLLPPLLPASALPREALRVENLPIVALNPDECKFAYGEYPYQFCGRSQVEGFAYCAGHLAVIFRQKGSHEQ